MGGGERAITIDDVPLDWCFQPGVKLDFRHLPDGHVVMGLFPVFWVIGYIFIHSKISAAWRAFWCVLPFVAFCIDTSGWFVTINFGQAFVYQIIVGGALFAISLAVMILTSLYQLWITPWRSRARSALDDSRTSSVE